MPLDPEKTKLLCDRFQAGQRGFTKHNTFANEIAEAFREDTVSLMEHLKPFLKILLQRFKREPPAERTVRFVVKIVTCRKLGNAWCEAMTTNLMTWLLQHWNARDKAIRFRVCEILGFLLNELDENFEIDEDLWTAMEEKLLVRLRDKVPQIRKAACVALNRLQMPDFEDDKVIPAIAFMMDHDSNKDCRREALIRLDMSKHTLMKILRRIRDVDYTVRVTAFKRLCQVDIVALTIYDRVIILKTGLKDRHEKVKQSCTKLLKRWLKGQGDDVLRFLKLIDPENYESECELILKHLIDMHFEGTHAQPPYKDSISPENVFYWRVLANKAAEKGDEDSLDRIMPDIRDFCKTLSQYMEEEFIAWQMLKLALHLDFRDEFGRNELVSLGRKIMETTTASTELIPFATKVLREILNDEDYIRLACQVINDIRDPLDEVEPEEDEKQRQQYEQRLDALHQQREQLREEKLVAVRTEDFETAQLAKQHIMDLDNQMQIVENLLNAREKRDQDTWKRVLTIVGDLLEFTQLSVAKGLGKQWLEPLLNNTLIPAVSHEDPFVREPGLLSFGLYCMLDKEIARKNLILFLNVLQNDQLALQYLSLKIMFDLFMIFDLFEGEELIAPAPADELEEAAPGSGKGSGNATRVLELMKSYLNTEDHDMLACAVEGFCKLLFLNRLPIYQIDVLSRLFLLYFNVVTETNEHIRQCLSMFFPLYASNKTPAGKGNRKTIARCLMPCLRAVAYAPKDSALTTVPINKLTEYFLWLLEADPLTNPNAEQQTVEATDTMSFHESIAFDVLFEIEANIESSGVRNLCRVLSILTLDKKNQHNVKQYKVLLDRIVSKVGDKMGTKYLVKFRANLEVADAKPDENLDEDNLMKLDMWRAEQVESAARALKVWIQQQTMEDGEGEDGKLESPILKGALRKRLGNRHCELINQETGEVTFGSPDAQNKRKKTKGIDTEGHRRKKKRTRSPGTVQKELEALEVTAKEVKENTDEVSAPVLAEGTVEAPSAEDQNETEEKNPEPEVEPQQPQAEPSSASLRTIEDDFASPKVGYKRRNSAKKVVKTDEQRKKEERDAELQELLESDED